MLSNSVNVAEFIGFLESRMCDYMFSTLGNGQGDILLPPITILDEGNLPQCVYRAFIESATLLNDIYCGGRYLAIDDERPLQCYMYAMLFHECVYGINIETGEKKLYTLSESVLRKGLYESMWTSVDGKSDIDLKVQRMIENIRGNNKVTETIYNGGNYVYAYRLDRAFHIRDDRSMHYTPVAPRTFIDLNTEVLIPYSVYKNLTQFLINSMEKSVYSVKYGNRVTMATYNKKVLDIIFDGKRASELLSKCEEYTQEDLFEFSVPNLLASVYSDGTNRYTLEGISNTRIMSLAELDAMLKGEKFYIYNQEIDFSLRDVDVRGAKNYLKDKLGYENLSDDRKAIVDSYTDTEAYRYLQTKTKGKIDTYGTRLKLPKEGVKVDIPMTEREFRALLQEGVYEIEFYSRRGLRKLVCTGNNGIVELVYGEDYRIYCNSENSIIKEFYNSLKYYIKTDSSGYYARYYIFENMTKKFGLTYEMFGLETPDRVESVDLNTIAMKLEDAVKDIRDSTQNAKQILVTCLTDRKPKEGAGRNLTRSLYLETVRSVKLLTKASDLLQ